MNFSKINSRNGLLMAAVIAVSALAAGNASATTTFDTPLASPPGVYFGTGNTNAHFVTNEVDNIELGLGTIERYLGPIAPDADTSIYHVLTGVTGVAGKTGTDWGFEFSINTDVDTFVSGLTLADFTASLCVQDVGMGQTFCGNPLSIPDNSYHHDLAGDENGAQNSEALQFLNDISPDTRYFDPLFEINANDTYIFTLTLSDANNPVVDSVQMTDIAGTGVPIPEPLTLSLFGAGLVGAVALRRRRRKAA